jgi:LPXTG-motif cell wall-anchored protein
LVTTGKQPTASYILMGLGAILLIAGIYVSNKR